MKYICTVAALVALIAVFTSAYSSSEDSYAVYVVPEDSVEQLEPVEDYYYLGSHDRSNYGRGRRRRRRRYGWGWGGPMYHGGHGFHGHGYNGHGYGFGGPFHGPWSHGPYMLPGGFGHVGNGWGWGGPGGFGGYDGHGWGWQGGYYD